MNTGNKLRALHKRYVLAQRTYQARLALASGAIKK